MQILDWALRADRHMALFHTKRFQNARQRTKTRECALEQVRTNKGGEPQPVFSVEMGQGETQQDERTGNGKNNSVDGHSGKPFSRLVV